VSNLLQVVALGLVLELAAYGADGIDYNRQIRPVLAEKCYACHGPDANKRKAGLRLDQEEVAKGVLESGMRAIVPGDPGESELVRRILTGDEDEVMPPPEVKKRPSATCWSDGSRRGRNMTSTGRSANSSARRCRQGVRRRPPPMRSTGSSWSGSR
jgi:hypothetical protein